MSTGPQAAPPTGRVLLAGAPLGNAGDASARLAEALGTAPVIAAEDTRRLRRLCADLGVTPAGRVISFFEGNEAGRIPGLLAALGAGEDVLVVTDAGMPSISDPGYRLVRAALDAGFDVGVLPGPSAVLAALAVSGLPVDRFCFEGFLPRRSGQRRRALAGLADERRTQVFFEAPHRLAEMLADAVEAFGAGREAAVCRELTKTYEQVLRAPLGELAQWAVDGEVRGEITVVIAGVGADAESGAGAATRHTPETLAKAVALRVAAGEDRRTAIGDVARELGLAKRQVYDAVVAAKTTAAQE